MNLTTKIKEAKHIIRQALDKADPEAPLLVNFSGGKDSTAVFFLAMEVTDNIRCFYMASGIELPGALEHAVHASQAVGIPILVSWPHDYQGPFEDLVRRFEQWPCIERAWCSIRLKARPGRYFLRKMYGKAPLAKLTGVRRQESSRRTRIYQAREPIVKDAEHAGSYLVHPILEWTDSDVMQFLEHYPKLPAKSPLYASAGVSGCGYCPFYSERIIERIERVFPGHFDGLIKLEEEIGKPALQNQTYLRHVVERARFQLTLPFEEETDATLPQSVAEGVPALSR
jgi:3'-phosphoadenosine 5'-phosphosulfate sulfotransferase (PAPS reductase)/FAD synthetase